MDQTVDETMSQDAAFVPTEPEQVFKFDSDAETSPASPANEDVADTTPDSAEEKADEATEVGQRVPYSRFKKKADELESARETLSEMEARLAALEESKASDDAPSEPDMPPEWVRLYGDSDAAREAWAIQAAREAAILEAATERAVDRISRREADEAERVATNEEAIDEGLSDLQEKIGRKLTPRQEEEVLGIVDEFSPLGEDGRYAALFPMEKAYEIYALRQSQRGLGTARARAEVADLTGSQSAGDADPSEAPFKRGWDSWRSGL